LAECTPSDHIRPGTKLVNDLGNSAVQTDNAALITYGGDD